MSTVGEWMDVVSGPEWLWYSKYLSGNDTLLNGSHQAGPYFPRDLIFKLFPALDSPSEANPRWTFHAAIDSHLDSSDPTVIWYNNRLTGGTRNECRITNWGGRSSPILDPESTGSLCVFAFRGEPGGSRECRIWLCRTIEEEDLVLSRAGPVEPGAGLVFAPSGWQTGLHAEPEPGRCRLSSKEIDPAWIFEFPGAQRIVEIAITRERVAGALDPDRRLLARRRCEYDVFRSIEEAVVLPRIREGFATVDIFVDYANAVTNRRKARSGLSLELHVRAVFEEEKVAYSHGAVSEGGKRPDFLFPSVYAYRDAARPASRLRMLAVKTTCKDRWRQILNEAERIPRKHLLTLQEGLSLTQWEEMRQAGVELVVPAPLHSSFHADIRPHLLSFERFIRESRSI